MTTKDKEEGKQVAPERKPEPPAPRIPQAASYEVRNISNRPVDTLRVSSKEPAVHLLPKQGVVLKEKEISKHMKKLAQSGILRIKKK